MTKDKKAALKEATTDTLLATVINFPLNMLLLFLANRTFLSWMETEAEQIFWTSVYLTVVFSAVAITRKTYVRLYFNRKQLKKEAKRT